MAEVTDDQINGLTNALQLCITSQIMGWYRPNHKDIQNTVVITFDHKSSNDTGLKKFNLLIQGQWGAPQNNGRIQSYTIQNFDPMTMGLLTSLLLLTRLQDEQIIALSSEDARFRPFAEALGLMSKETGMAIATLSDMRDIIFKKIEQKKISLKTVAERTGISQVSLSNFKAGKDIRISTLLKIAKALGITVSLN